MAVHPDTEQASWGGTNVFRASLAISPQAPGPDGRSEHQEDIARFRSNPSKHLYQWLSKKTFDTLDAHLAPTTPAFGIVITVVSTIHDTTVHKKTQSRLRVHRGASNKAFAEAEATRRKHASRSWPDSLPIPLLCWCCSCEARAFGRRV